MNIVDLKSFRMGFGLRFALVAFIALGVVAWYLQYTDDHARAWLNILIGTAMTLGLALCGLFFTAIQHIVKASWSVSIRRVMEAMAMTLPLSVILLSFVFMGTHHIYEWSNEAVVAADTLLQHKEGFLNPKFFGFRLFIYCLVWLGLTGYLVRNSLKQDVSGAVNLTNKNWSFSSLTLVLFGFSVSLAAFDLLMSLEPHWFSTMFGVYYFAGFFQAGLALIYIVSYYLEKKGVLKGFVGKEHFHDLARFVFGFSVFWAYIAYSQYMLIWYGNLPEETFFFLERWAHGWEWMILVIFMLRFVIPFLVLMPYGVKRNPKYVLPICVLIILSEWIELFWIVMPSLRFHHHGEALHSLMNWKDVVVGIGFFSLFILVLGLIMERIRMVPIRDPRLERSIHHHG